MESRYLDILRGVKSVVDVPVAVKLSPFFSAPVHFMRRLVENGAAGIVLFNRFYQPDIDVENLEATPTLLLSDSSELRLRLRWLAAAYGNVQADLAATGGVHTAIDAVKALMAGASTVQLAGFLLREGVPGFIRMRRELGEWLDAHEYERVTDMVGSMSLERTPDPQAFTRANYVKVLQNWHGA